jgi:hypothetical protein
VAMLLTTALSYSFVLAILAQRIWLVALLQFLITLLGVGMLQFVRRDTLERLWSHDLRCHAVPAGA